MNNIELGSSPHTRGTRIDADRYRPNTRFIPAYAGNAPRMPRRPTRSPVHPRIRGERKTSDLCKQHPDGSSPHTRGTLHRNVRNLVGRRFIPAYAGNASSACGQRSCSPVHPRIRGERLNQPHASARRYGSSPHTRGTLLESTTRLKQNRFIPAYAGNAARGIWSGPCWPVHPRIRGERTPWDSCCWAVVGSSPHTRGTHSQAAAVCAGKRFIPAYAGNARWWCRRQRALTVHPRIRGERLRLVGDWRAPVGSSPHTRGTPQEGEKHGRIQRFIPAYAGNAPR